MNINPISFGKTMKVVGINSLDSAYRMANLIDGRAPFSKKEVQIQKQLWQKFHCIWTRDLEKMSFL